MRSRVAKMHGMTLVELMIVVVIIGILAAISVVGYRKYIARARLSEATAMLAEFSAKEQLYFLEAGQFVEAHNNSVASSYPSTSEAAGEFWPTSPADASFDSARTPGNVYDSGGNMPTAWRQLGVRPRWKQLYCTYLVNAGAAGSALPASSIGSTMWPISAQPLSVPWFYVLAACNLGGAAGWPNTDTDRYVTVLMLTHDSPVVRTIDENE